MDRLFTVRWPAFARLEAFLIFVAISAAYSKIPQVQPFLEGFSATGASRFGVSQAPLTWGAAAFLGAGPYLGAIIVADRVLGARHGFAWLSLLAVVVWAGLAALFSDKLVALLPSAWVGGSALVSFTVEVVIGAASIALLIHAKPLWVGLEDQGFVGVGLAKSGTSKRSWHANPWFSADPRGRTGRMTIGGPMSGLLGTVGLCVCVIVLKSGLLSHAAGLSVDPPEVSAPGEAEAWRMHSGAFVFRVIVNDQPTPMLFDTGATWVTLRAEDAERLGIATDTLAYTVRASTANGIALLAKVTIDTMTVGGITMHHVPAVVAKPGVLHDNLLGQTFLTRLRDFKVEGDRVILRAD